MPANRGRVLHDPGGVSPATIANHERVGGRSPGRFHLWYPLALIPATWRPLPGLPAATIAQQIAAALVMFGVFDLSASVQARNEAMDLVLGNAGSDFQAAARTFIKAMPADEDFTGEDIRRGCEAAGIIPHHKNSWGAVVCSALRAGVIAPTGDYRSMTDVRSRARKTQVLRRT